MGKINKKWSYFYLAILLIISIAIFMSFSFAQKRIRVGYYDDYPFAFNNEENIPEGFIINLLDRFAKNSDYNLEYVYSSWDDLLKKLDSGDIDVLVDIVESEARSKKYSFNEMPLGLNFSKICTNKEYRIYSILDLEKYKIGYVRSDVNVIEKNGLMELEKEFDLNFKYVIYETYEQLLKGIDSGEVQAGVITRGIVQQIYEYDNIRETGFKFSMNTAKIATKKGKNLDFLKEFDNMLYKWKSNKRCNFKNKYNHWVKDLDTKNHKIFYTQYKDEIIFGSIGIIILIFILRYQVFHKSRVLKKTSYEKMILDNKFKNLVSFLSLNMRIKSKKENKLFLRELLSEIYELLEASDSAIAYSCDENGKFKIIDVINFSKEAEEINLNYEVLKYNEEVVLINEIDKRILTYIEQETDRDLVRKQLKHVKESLLVTFQDNELMYSGLLFNNHKGSKKSFKKESIRMVQILKSVVDSYILNEKYHKIHEIFQKDIIFSFIQMLELHDEYTKGHSEAVANLASEFANYLEMSDEKVEEIYWAGLVHDIGKILVDKKIINKKDKLTYEEYNIIKKHPENGAKALQKSDLTKDISEYILYHHERVDGLGYPEGLKGDEIPIESQIIALADTYDAMTSNRVYRSSMTKEKALLEIENNLGTQFDKILGKKFIYLVKNDKLR